MKKIILALSLLFPAALLADTVSEVGAYSNFIWRGTTFTENKPAIQGEIDHETEQGFFLGGFFSNAEFSDEAMSKHATVSQEMDAMIGKRWYGKNWEAQLMYGKFFFPNAGVFDTDEFNFTFKYESLFLELSYMDDYFGYQGVYQYVRVGYEWIYKESIEGAIFVGYNAFKKPKGNLKSRCLDDACSEEAFTTTGAGNPDYIDIYFVNRKTFDNKMAAEIAFNWTNRHEYLADGGIITKQKAKDFALIVAYIIPFPL